MSQNKFKLVLVAASAALLMSCGKGSLPASSQVTVNGDAITLDSEVRMSEPMVAEFHIPAGTNKQNWNTSAQPVEVFVGQTLKIINDDNIVHRLHTNGKPCPHGDEMPANGGIYNCVTTQSYVESTDGKLYDHNFGPTAQFFLRVYDGATLYATNCAKCHGVLAQSNRKGATAEKIANAINGGVPKMKGLSFLTPKEIEAISFALSN